MRTPSHTPRPRAPHLTPLTHLLRRALSAISALSALSALALSALALTACMAEPDLAALDLDERCLESARQEMDRQGLVCSCDPLSARWVCVTPADQESFGGEEPAPDQGMGEVIAAPAQPDPSQIDPVDDIAAATREPALAPVEPEADAGMDDGVALPEAPVVACDAWEYASFNASVELECDGVDSYIRYSVTQSAWVGVRRCGGASDDQLRVYLSPNKITFYPVLANDDLAPALCALIDAGSADASWLPDDSAPPEGRAYVAAEGQRLDSTSEPLEGLSSGLISCVGALQGCSPAP